MNKVKYITGAVAVLPVYDGGDAQHRDLVLAGISAGLIEFLPGQTPTLTIEGAAVARLAKFYAIGKKSMKRVGFIGRPPWYPLTGLTDIPHVGAISDGCGGYLHIPVSQRRMNSQKELVRELLDACDKFAHKAPSNVWDKLSTDIDNNKVF